MNIAEPGPRAPWARRSLQVIFLVAAGLFLFRFALPGVILGGSYIAGDSIVSPHLDNETRFLSALALGYAIVFAWLIGNFERHPRVAALVAAIALIGGAMRVVSIALYGPPEPPAIVAAVLEFVIPIAIFILLRRGASDAHSARV